jgi:hypothetical protein
MNEYISVAGLEVNGTKVDDFKGVGVGEQEIRIPVNLMNKTGFARKTKRYTITVDYVVPKGAPFDWESVENGTLTIDYGARRESFSGVSCVKVGEAKLDGDKEMTQQIDLIAESRQ